MSSFIQRRLTMEQRQHERFPAHFRSAFSSVNRVEGEGTVVDLSLRGCGIVCRTAIHPGTTLTLRIQVPGPETALTVRQAVVRWCRDGRIGLEFLSLSPEEWARLQRLVKALTRHPYEQTHETQEHPGA
ncbi:MAG: PilZ domain-containing protein [Nitrospira sp.]|nr:MAG: PilZ domain-containing protein [Nitrospira sp.]